MGCLSPCACFPVYTAFALTTHTLSITRFPSSCVPHQKVLLDKQNDWGESPLHLAAAAGHQGAVTILLDHNASTVLRDKWGRTALLRAKEHGERATLSVLETRSALGDDQLLAGHDTAPDDIGPLQTQGMQVLEHCTVVLQRFGRCYIVGGGGGGGWGGHACVRACLAKLIAMRPGTTHSSLYLPRDSVYHIRACPAWRVPGDMHECALHDVCAGQNQQHAERVDKQGQTAHAGTGPHTGRVSCNCDS